MSRLILSYRLPQERCEAKIASQSMDWALAVSELDNRLRALVKYDAQGYDVRTLEYVRDLLRECLDADGVSLEDIE